MLKQLVKRELLAAYREKSREIFVRQRTSKGFACLFDERPSCPKTLHVRKLLGLRVVDSDAITPELQVALLAPQYVKQSSANGLKAGAEVTRKIIGA